MFGLGFQEVLILFVIALLLFGSRRLPEVGRAFGKAISEFKKGMQGEEKPEEGAGKDGDKNQPRA